MLTSCNFFLKFKLLKNLAPKNLLKPVIKTIYARSAVLTWQKAGISGGLVTHYTLHGYPILQLSNQSTRIDDTAIFEGTIHNLEANSGYKFTVEVFTAKGSIESEASFKTTLTAG